MSSTPSNALRPSSANGAARRTASKRSSTFHCSADTMATICCARTSSGLRGYLVLSTCASCIARVTAAHATRSPRNFGTMMPRLASPIVCPDRPMRCMPLATDGGASIWMTRSIAPISMPSSSEDVATRPRMSPALRRSSTSIRCARATEPWCDRTSVSPASSLIALASRSAIRRLFTKISVERWALMSSRSRG